MKSNRIFALLLAMLLVLTSIGIAEEMLDTAFTFEIEGEEPAAPEIAPEEDAEVDMTPKAVESDFEFYEEDDGTRIIRIYHGHDANVVIPASWNVSAIDSWAISNNHYLKSITLPSTLRTIYSSAFQGCANLKTVNLPEGLETIGEGAFRECLSLATIKLPKSLKKLGDSVFERSRIKSITIPAGVSAIPNYAFANCSELTSVTLSKGLQSIGQAAFLSCIKLKSIKLPDTLTDFGSGAFASCIGLTSIKLPNGVKSIPNAVFTGCSALKSVTLPAGLERIGGQAFAYCFNLKSIVIPDSVQFIDSEAFNFCINLGTITLPSDPLNISYTAFVALEDPKWNVFAGSSAEAFVVQWGYTPTYRKDYALAAVEKSRECYIGDVIDMTAFVAKPAEPTGAIFVLKSSSAKVLTVDNEALTAKAIAEGSATFTATMTVADPKNEKKTLAKKTASMKVKVLDPNKLSTVLIEGEATRSMTVGQKLALNAVTVPNAENINCTWKSSKAAVASVDANGEVTAVKKGSATVTVTATQGKVKKTASTKINVADAKPIVITITDWEGKPFENNELYLSNRDGIESCILSWTDGNNGIYREQATVNWRTDNPDSLWLSDADTPETEISLRESGEATVTLTVTIGGKEYTASLHVFPNDNP